MPLPGRQAVFLDKDGTLIEDIPYSVDPKRMSLLPGVSEGLARLHRAGFKLVVVSNQSGVARGLFSEEALEPVREKLAALFAEAGAELEGFYYCPHHAQAEVAAYRQDCLCRKPQPGMLRAAARDLDVDLTSSWLIGNRASDIEAGQRAGCRTVLLRIETDSRLAATPTSISKTFLEAVDYVLFQA